MPYCNCYCLKKSNEKNIVWTVIAISSIGITVTIFDAIFKLGELKLYESNTVEHQEVNLFSYKKERDSKIEKISRIKEVASIDNFKSGSYEVPSYDWTYIKKEIKNQNPKFIIIYGFSDPHKTKDESIVNNTIIAYKRAKAVKLIMDEMLINIHDLPVFIMSNGFEYAVKLLDSQVESYSVDRKVEIYFGI
ncbi:hypothetical protein P3589_22260 [Vibrio parahaemolyticus]|uniref:hypothetical protein n=1 Tax=Vibrio parahaemolyticus TaxID=670 RepID=UPI0003FFA9EE|nr:hypothetical protein [Vibrio parahaemolyticus]EKA7384272.1 hypothetical protein [Vibrio parahaemolyticus]EME0904227.1 hypothetical protein [Vibrio parahaemolyticus]MBE5155641.1 hypothetical protein [Vibrio parahaemolyticus]MBE5164966.1 hypothetical protein [Vibrio parahaemolyticus]MDF4666195.1 hypothetical protein [Vibrio parahaemolyticus]